MTYRPVALLALLGVVLTSPVRADESPDGAPDKTGHTLLDPTPDDRLRDIDTDWPDKTDTPHTIDAGHLQAEIGLVDYGYDRIRYSGVNIRAESFGTGQINLHLGVLDDLELAAELESYTTQWSKDYLEKRTSHAAGVGDLVLGGKLNLWGNDDDDELWATSLAIQPQLKLPTATRDIGNGHDELFVGFPFLVGLPAGFHLGLQTTFSWERDSENATYVAGWQNSFTIEHELFDDTEAYLEYWSHVSTERHQQTQQTVDAGIAYLVMPNLLLDAGVNFGLTRTSGTVELLAGFTVRY